MHSRLYPVSLAEINSWWQCHDVTLNEAHKRFVQFVVLECIAGSPAGRQLNFKGGNALRFLHQNPRSTVDLDFTAENTFPDDADQIRHLLDRALRQASHFGIRAKCQKIKRNPPGTEKMTPTYEITVAYQFPGDRRYHDFEDASRPIPTIVRLEISISDVVCETEMYQLHPDHGPQLKVCVLEDIIAEKLRALLQQRPRKRHRKQDVYDIARMVRQASSQIDRGKVAEYFRQKSRAREIEVCRSAFDEEIKQRASFEYETLFDDLNPEFIPFDQAWTILIEFLSELNIPE